MNNKSIIKLLQFPVEGHIKRWPRKFWIGLIVLVGLALALAWWGAQHWRTSDAASAGEWVSVGEQSVEQSITTEGALAEASAVTVTAPFEGSVIKRWVKQGDWVAVGAPLVQLDISTVQAELRDAQAANIRAQEDLDGLMNWQTGSEVKAAQRQAANAQSQIKVVQGRLEDTQTLFDKGIVARSEVDGLQSELSNAMEQGQNAKDSLHAALRKGSPTQQQIARIEAESRKLKMDMLQKRVQQATLTAPVAGIVLRPTQSEMGSTKELDVGSIVSNRAVLMLIGDSTKYLIHAALDEFDVAKVKVGMPVEVSLNTDKSVSLRGELARISAQARSSQRFGSSGSSPMFDIEVLVSNIPTNMRARLKLGMMTRLTMIFDKHPAVLTVPLASVRVDSSGRFAVLRKAADGNKGGVDEVSIRTGATSADGVVVLKGLLAGDKIWVPSETQSRAGDSQLAPSREPGEPAMSMQFGLGRQR